MARTTATASTGRPSAGVSSAAEKRSMTTHADASHTHLCILARSVVRRGHTWWWCSPFVARPPEYGKFRTRPEGSSVPTTFTEAYCQLGRE